MFRPRLLSLAFSDLTVSKQKGSSTSENITILRCAPTPELGDKYGRTVFNLCSNSKGSGWPVSVRPQSPGSQQHTVIVNDSSRGVFTFRTSEHDPSGMATFALYILKTPDLLHHHRYVNTCDVHDSQTWDTSTHHIRVPDVRVFLLV